MTRVAALLSLAAGAGGCSVFFPSTPSKGGGGGGPQGPWEVHPVRLNTVGFLPDGVKLATVIAPGGPTVEVHQLADDAMVWDAPLTTAVSDPLTGDPLWIADFTAFTTAGDYYLEVPGLGKSASFRIAPDVFNDVLTRSVLGMYGQRCGIAVKIEIDGDTFSHAACHKKDGSLKYLTGTDTIKESTGGWHDAGDYGKYMTNAGFTLGMMLAAWEQFQPALEKVSLPMIPEHGGVIPDYLAEAKWELDWLLTTPAPDGSGGIPHKLTGLVFEPFEMPESDLNPRYFTLVGTAATGDFVAVMAAAARIYKAYDPAFAQTCLDAALKSYEFLKNNTGPVVPETAAFTTGGYGDSSDGDERLWAAAELWETTADPAILADLEARAGTFKVQGNFDWQNVGNLGAFRYLLSKNPGRNPDLVAKKQTELLANADTLVSVMRSNAWGRPVGYWWGANGAVARTAMNLAAANALSPDPKYRDGILMQLDHLLGRNFYDRSQITMVGYHPPARPHHRPSASDNTTDPWPGLLVGGQDCPSGGSSCATAPTYDWADNQNAANLNEIAINWTGAVIFAAAAVAN